MRYFIFCALVIFVPLIIYDYGYSVKAEVYYSFGYKSPGDQLLYRGTHSRGYRPFVKRVFDFEYPPKNMERKHVINAIYVIDEHEPNGNVTIKEGGVGHPFVTLHLKSQRNNGFTFTIEIWGR